MTVVDAAVAAPANSHSDLESGQAVDKTRVSVGRTFSVCFVPLHHPL
ncbi:MAG: hypothetical protein IPL28_09490 [Chloroflexi bacterium]|nr:hypothetical protein [Chloroflexota bacterium]